MLVPRPRINLVLYYGALAPRAAWRAGVVASAGSEWSETAARVEAVGDEDTDSARGRRRGYLWAELMRRTFGITVCRRHRVFRIREHGAVTTLALGMTVLGIIWHGRDEECLHGSPVTSLSLTLYRGYDAKLGSVVERGSDWPERRAEHVRVCQEQHG